MSLAGRANTARMQARDLRRPPARPRAYRVCTGSQRISVFTEFAMKHSS
jgi:hypothetical protein